PAGQHAPAYLLIGQVKVDHAVDVVALQEELRLPAATRKAVDDESVVPVVHGQPVPDHRLHQVVIDQLTGVHDPPDLGAELGVVLDMPAQDVTDADLHQVQVAGEHGALGALAAPLDPHDDVLPHPLTLPR